MKFLLLTIIFFIIGCSNQGGYIIIKNDSAAPITNVTINYIVPKTSYVLGTIYPKSMYKYSIDYNYNETAIDISYVTKDQKIVNETVVGYSTSYNKKNVELIIK